MRCSRLDDAEVEAVDGETEDITTLQNQSAKARAQLKHMANVSIIEPETQPRLLRVKIAANHLDSLHHLHI